MALSIYLILITLSISNGITKFYDKRDDFYFDIVNFSYCGGGIPRYLSYGVYNLSLFVLQGYAPM